MLQPGFLLHRLKIVSMLNENFFRYKRADKIEMIYECSDLVNGLIPELLGHHTVSVFLSIFP